MKELLWEAARGFVEGLAAGKRGRDDAGRVERAVRENGWVARESRGGYLRLPFDDPAVGTREVHIVSGDTGHFTLLMVPSAASLPARQIDPSVLGYLLLRNAEMTAGMWQADKVEGGKATFALKYLALTEGIEAVTLKIIVGDMMAEAHDFDAKMRSAGLL